MRQIDEQDDGTEIALAVGDEIVVTLRENQTTGYRWTVGADGGPVCEIVSDDFDPPAGSAMGAGGHHRWRIRAVRQGRAAITLSSERFGKRGKSFTIHVVVH
jgi:predicted secreted protein